MIISHRGFHAPAWDAGMMGHMVMHSRYRFLLSRQRGIVTDDRLVNKALGHRESTNRTLLLLVMRGPVGLTSANGTEWLQDGEFAVIERDSDWGTRHLGPTEEVLIDWEDSPIGNNGWRPENGGRLSTAHCERVRLITNTIADAAVSPRDASTAIAETVEILRANGARFDRPHGSDLVEAVPRQMRRLSSTVDTVVRRLCDAPATVDFSDELGWSGRQVRRKLHEFHRRYAFKTRGAVRNLVKSWRTCAGVGLMTAEGATTEAVAHLLGYPRPSAFCRAFAALGLPSPGSVAETVAGMD